MDASSVTSTRTTKPPSLQSKASSTTLVPTSDQTQTASPEPSSAHLYKATGRPPNPDAQPKPKSKLSKLMSKLASPSVRRSLDLHERQLLEEERTGVKRVFFADSTAVAALPYTANGQALM